MCLAAVNLIPIIYVSETYMLYILKNYFYVFTTSTSNPTSPYIDNSYNTIKHLTGGIQSLNGTFAEKRKKVYRKECCLFYGFVCQVAVV